MGGKSPNIFLQIGRDEGVKVLAGGGRAPLGALYGLDAGIWSHEMNTTFYMGRHGTFRQAVFGTIVTTPIPPMRHSVATSNPVSVAQPLCYYHNNITGTLTLLACMQEASVRHIHAQAHTTP